ncbi:MAG: helicase-exonuclease AddAB subunit AddA [Bacilli bacterium]
MPNWTNDQQQAITTRGGKVLVSAAAGSGKTAVLTERVVNYLINGGNINELLIVTFTNAASFEMKSRIKESIQKEINKNPANSHLKKQILLIEMAKITTMDSFYGDIVKENFEKLKIMPNFKILTNEEENILKNKVASLILENEFEHNDLRYVKLLNMFNANSEDLIKSVILKISNFLDTIPFYETFLNKCKENYAEDSLYYKDLLFNSIKEKMISYKVLYLDIKEELYKASSDFDKLDNNFKNEINLINQIIDTNNFDDLSLVFRTHSFIRLATIKGHKDDPTFNKYKVIREDLKKTVTKDLSEFAFITEDLYKSEQQAIKSNLDKLSQIVIKFKNMLLNEKIKNNVYSFSDISHFVIKLLINNGNKTILAKNISKTYKEILIDEYQDTNHLQSLIFNTISDNGNNLFVVGDVKQSIYRFRSACPEIFNEDKSKARCDGFPRLITLSKNFRSRKQVLDFCNFIFENTMTTFLGEVDYNESEKLYLGADFKENDNAVPEIHIINNEEKTDDDDLSNVQKEAIYTAERIKKLLDEKYQVYDNKKQLYRIITPKDIVILFRTLKNAETYRKALIKRGINVYCESSKLYFDNYEIQLVIALLKVIDNGYDDVALMATLTSNLFNISEDSVANLKALNNYGYLYDVLKTSDDEKIKTALKTIDDFKRYSLNNSLYSLINYVYNKLNVIPIIGFDSSSVKNLTLMIKYALSFEEKSTKTLHEFVSYIEEILLQKGSFEGANPISQGDNVLITTIHKSKGLEYPIVFLCETGRKFNFKDLTANLMIDENLGITFNLSDNKNNVKYESVSMMLFKEVKKQMQLSEELRILYVALTRAKEKLIIIGVTNNLTSLVNNASAKIGDNKTISNLYLKNASSYLSWIIANLLRHPSATDLRDISNISNKVFNSNSNVVTYIKNASEINEDEFTNDENKHTFVFNEDVSEILNYTYKNEALTKVPNKLSVTDLKKRNSDHYYKKPSFLNNKKSSASIGTLYHKIFEVLPLEKYNVSLLEEKLKDLVKEGVVSQNEIFKVDINKLFCYLTSDIYDMMISADEVLREEKIIFTIPSSYYDINLKEGNILVDGTIDLLFLKDNVYYIVDYKTDDVKVAQELKDRYKIQLDLYELAVKSKFKASFIKKYIYSIKLNRFIEV